MNHDKIICCDVTKGIPLPDKSVHCVITSPPYWGLRDYGTAQWEGGDPECDHTTSRSRGDDIRLGDKQGTSVGSRPNTQQVCKCGAKRIDAQLGLEKTPEEYIEKMVAVFRHVWRVLRDDGTLWLNIGDSYATHASKRSGQFGKDIKKGFDDVFTRAKPTAASIGLKEKDLCMMPARLAIALQADGWYLRNDNIEEVEFYCPCGCGYIMEERIWRYSQDRDIIWKKPNPMPESCTDRCTKSHEYLFMLTKKPKYFWDADAVREPQSETSHPRYAAGVTSPPPAKSNSKELARPGYENWRETTPVHILPNGRNKRDVWTIPTQSFPEAHFATFPEKLVEPCIKAGTSEKGCCPECGSPWVRVVEKDTGPHPNRWSKKDDAKNFNMKENQYVEGSGLGVAHITTTIGWKPTCKHFDKTMGGGGTSFKGHSGNYKADGTPINPPKITTGFKETCECGSIEPVPCTVYDPFMGSGTVGLVAYKLSRHYIGTELNPEYIKMAEKRIGQEKDKYSLIEA